MPIASAIDDHGQLRPETIAAAVRKLEAGEVVALPTETVYGLGANAFDRDAILKVFATKERPSFDPLIAHIPLFPGEKVDFDALIGEGILDGKRLQGTLRKRAELLATAWPGPLTLVLPKGEAIPDEATSGLDTVAVRAPAHPVMRAVIAGLGNPVVAPSANRFGRISPTTAAHVASELGDKLELILDGGPCEHGVESTIVGIDDVAGVVRLLRPGALPKERLQSLLRAPLQPPHKKAATPTAPGMLSSHYAPRKPVVLWREGHAAPVLCGPAAALLLHPPATRLPFETTEALALSDDGNAAECARNLFATLRRLDGSEGAEVIVAQLPNNEEGLFAAIADRLRRAAADR